MKVRVVETNPWEGVEKPPVPKSAPTAPKETDIDHFFKWLDAKNWELLSLFFRIKAFVGCRTNDLCQALSSQFDAKTGTLLIKPEDDKTNQERRIKLPTDYAKRLKAVMGKTYLWERYLEDAKKYRPGRRNAKVFKPSLIYWCVDDICPQYREAHPDAYPITPHDLRRRAITLAVIANKGNVDGAAKALSIHPDTARENYIDVSQAYDTDAIFKLLEATAK